MQMQAKWRHTKKKERNNKYSSCQLSVRPYAHMSLRACYYRTTGSMWSSGLNNVFGVAYEQRWRQRLAHNHYGSRIDMLDANRFVVWSQVTFRHAGRNTNRFEEVTEAYDGVVLTVVSTSLCEHVLLPATSHCTTWVCAIGRCAEFNLQRNYHGQDIAILSDSQEAIKALSKAKITSRLGAVNRLTTRWVPGHNNILGNELADNLARKCAKKPSNWAQAQLVRGLLKSLEEEKRLSF